jgi:hypothetical protein
MNGHNKNTDLQKEVNDRLLKKYFHEYLNLVYFQFCIHGKFNEILIFTTWLQS